MKIKLFICNIISTTTGSIIKIYLPNIQNFNTWISFWNSFFEFTVIEVVNKREYRENKSKFRKKISYISKMSHKIFFFECKFELSYILKSSLSQHQAPSFWISSFLVTLFTWSGRFLYQMFLAPFKFCWPVMPLTNWNGLFNLYFIWDSDNDD